MSSFSVNANIAKAKTIDTALYTSPEVFELCKEKIFAISWQYVGGTHLVPKPETVYPLTLLPGFMNEPLVLTHDKAGKIHLLSNVCTHRGNLVAEKACSASRLRCRYHGRTFELNGKFKNMPEFEGVENFPSEADSLHALPLYQWSQWLFTTLEPKFAPEIFFKDMIERVQWMPLDEFEYRPELSREFEVHCNWALYCENYLEGFHIPFVHAGLNAVLDFDDYTTELFYPYASLQIGLAKHDEHCFDLPKSSPDYGRKVAAYYFWIFPNMMFNFYPWGLSINLVQPTGVEKCKVQFITYMWDERKRNEGAGADLHRVELEDEEIVQQVQKGVKSRFYKHGRYSPNREQGTHHFHRILSEMLA